MGFGGPVWHSSVSANLDVERLKTIAIHVLEGVGDPEHEWYEWTGRAYHVRRRLTDEEQKLTGPAVDCRGTGEWSKRYYDIAHKLPEAGKRFAMEESGILLS